MADDDAPTAMSWPRAALEVAATLVAAFVALVVGSNLIVTGVTGLDREWRAILATGWFSVSLALLAWGLRRLQARHVV